MWAVETMGKRRESAVSSVATEILIRCGAPPHAMNLDNWLINNVGTKENDKKNVDNRNAENLLVGCRSLMALL